MTVPNKPSTGMFNMMFDGRDLSKDKAFTVGALAGVSAGMVYYYAPKPFNRMATTVESTMTNTLNLLVSEDDVTLEDIAWTAGDIVSSILGDLAIGRVVSNAPSDAAESIYGYAINWAFGSFKSSGIGLFRWLAD